VLVEAMVCGVPVIGSDLGEIAHVVGAGGLTFPGGNVDALTAALKQIAVMRLDGDMYDSTMVALRSLYPKLSVGGYVIVDDYLAVGGCKHAVDDFRAERGITDELCRVDWTCHFWRRTA
jgi:O-methyltransferase